MTENNNLIIVSRKQAIQLGLKKYYDGKACGKGHVVEKFLNGGCTTCVRIRGKKNYKTESYLRRKNKNPLKIILERARQRSKQYNREFSLSLEDINIGEYCPCCGNKFHLVYLNTGNKGANKRSPSIDRFDSNKGYTKENSIIICHRCNNLKNNATSEELKTIAAWMDKMSEKNKALF